jgi:hypothetical protein
LPARFVENGDRLPSMEFMKTFIQTLGLKESDIYTDGYGNARSIIGI